MNKQFSGAILAGTLLVTATPSFAVAVGTEKHGKWKLIDEQVSRVFQPDGISEKELTNPGGGKWGLIDNQVTREFFPDTDPGHKAPGGSWTLNNLSFDRQFVPDSSKTAKVGTREIKRTMVADKLTYGADFSDRVKNYGNESTEYRNEYNKEELMGTDNYQSVSGSSAYTIQNFRIDNHKDKYIHHPFTSTYNYAETLKHNYTFAVTNEVTTRISFTDAVYGGATYADLVEQNPDTVLSETSFATTGKKLAYSSPLPNEAPRVNSSAALALAPTGDDIEGPTHVVTAGAKQQRMIGESVKRNDKLASATTENAQDKVLMSNTQVGGNASAKVTYSGVKEYKAQGLGTMKVSEKTTTVEERKDLVGKDYSDRVEKLKDTIANLSDKTNAKKIENLLASIKDTYAAADNQDKKDLLKQEVIIAITDSPLSSDVRQSIQTILEGKTAASTTVTQNSNSGKSSTPVVSIPVINTPVISVIPSNNANNKSDETKVSQTNPTRGHGRTPGGRLDKPSAQSKVDTPTAPVRVTPTPAPTPKPDPMVLLLQNLSYSNKDLANYLNLARSSSDPAAYFKKAASYLTSKDDLSALNSVMDAKITEANKSFKILTAAALSTQKLTINASFKLKKK